MGRVSSERRDMKRDSFFLVSVTLIFAGANLLFSLSSFERTMSYFWDDTFYYAAIARNIAEGVGASADGINLTSGFQPLWGITLVPLYWISPDSDTTPIRILMVMQLILVSLGVLILYSVLRRKLSSPAALVGAVVPLWAGFNLFIGQEQALFFFLHVAVVYLVIRDWDLIGEGGETQRALQVGIVSGLLFLTRTDGLIMLSFLWLGYLLMHYFSRPTQAPRFALAVQETAYMIGASAPFGLGYVAWNLATFEHVLPISSSLKSTFPDPKFDLSRVLGLEWFYLSGGLMVAYGIVYVWHRRWSTKSDTLAHSVVAMTPGVLINLSFIALFVDWAALANQLVVVVVPTAITIALFVELALNSLSKWQQWTPRLAVVPVILAVGLVAGYQAVRFHNQEYNPAGAYGMYRIVRDMAKIVPDDAVFAYTDSTVLGYFSGHHTINLDGLVNNWEFQDYLHSNRFPEYAERMGIDYIVTRWSPNDDPLGDCLNYYFLSRLDRPVLRITMALPADALVKLYPYPPDDPRWGVYIWDFHQALPYTTCEEFLAQ